MIELAKEKVRQALNWVKEKVRQALNWVKEKVRQALNWVKEKVRQALNWVKEKVRQALNWVKEKVRQALNWAKEKVRQALNWAKEKVRQALNWVKEKTKPIFCIVICIAVILAIHFFGIITWFENYIQISKEVKITDIVSTLVTCSIFFFGYQISKAQKNIAKEKLKLDLFDRRYKIYNAFKNGGGALNKKLDENEVTKIMSRMYDGYQESLFLFGEEVYDRLYHIYLAIQSLLVNTGQFNYLKSFPHDDDLYKNEIQPLVQKMRQDRTKIDEFYHDIDKIFSKYMSFEDLNIK
ncbi:uncharacterized protein ZMO1_ZMOp36x027 (plasmid) [Zymomonas mobilis subsp. mobilis ZM4 = ATCC 31821]|uniref:hypothetical protein n=3 Tax=Zymomonas mobilis TaxID=542 RepID=UPI000D223AFA|nr:hypothetical protein [Zymomonas mobilis]AVZ26884.1 hypothetical protein ZMO2_ZMOp36x027 [Zymomonas mobilis subsp. mobilis]AVZ43216.1 uncharacterized protein ZMO1_ZMOp36x027 [Zymomonas mobilis subsp. mobilis ZM4 = ATCC 31821]UBQ08696.1 apolipoprotein A1/A4/E family protein [Zymomonas mobilis]